MSTGLFFLHILHPLHLLHSLEIVCKSIPLFKASLCTTTVGYVSLLRLLSEHYLTLVCWRWLTWVSASVKSELFIIWCIVFFCISVQRQYASCSSRTMNSIYAANTCSKGMGDLHMFYMCIKGCDHFMTNTVCHICVFRHSQWDLINTRLHRKKTHDSVKISRKNISIKHNQRARLKRPTSPPQHSSAGIIRNALNFSATITITKWHY